MEVKETNPLKWPDGWRRTLITDRRTQGSWKKNIMHYRSAVEAELKRTGVGSVLITRNNPNLERQDPGVAVWFSMGASEDFSWQKGLKLDNPVPSLEEIDKAFRELARIHHSDAIANGSGGDPQEFIKLNKHRENARNWVLGKTTPQYESCVPMDLFTDARQNLAAVAATLRHIRALDRLGMPSIVQRVMQQTFKTALPEHREAHVTAPA